MSITYNVVFLIEFLLLVIGHGVLEHFTSPEWAWHLFDAVVVFFGVVEVVLFTLQQGAACRAYRAIYSVYICGIYSIYSIYIVDIQYIVYIEIVWV